MPKNTRLSGSIDQIERGFVEREATPRLLMKLGSHLHFAGLSLSNTVSILERFGVERAWNETEPIFAGERSMVRDFPLETKAGATVFTDVRGVPIYQGSVPADERTTEDIESVIRRVPSTVTFVMVTRVGKSHIYKQLMTADKP